LLIRLPIFGGLDPAHGFQRRERRPHRQGESHPCVLPRWRAILAQMSTPSG
jgi:hypothetical protein